MKNLKIVLCSAMQGNLLNWLSLSRVPAFQDACLDLLLELDRPQSARCQK